MNKGIKFRAICVDTEKWVYGYFLMKKENLK